MCRIGSKGCKIARWGKKLGSFASVRTKSEISLSIEGFICKMLASMAHRSDIRIIQGIHRSAKEETQGLKHQNDTFRNAFGEFPRNPIHVYFESHCLAIGKSGDFDNTQKPTVDQTARKTGRGKGANAVAAGECLQVAEIHFSNVPPIEDHLGKN